MPAQAIFKRPWRLTTRPFAGDDLHVMCLILGFYRIVQLACLIPMFVKSILNDLVGGSFTVILNETERYPSWCFPPGQYYNQTTFEESMQNLDGATYDFSPHSTRDSWITIAVFYLFVDIAWIAMTWSSSSIGTPTQPMRRERYVRNLMKFKMVSSILFPLVLLGYGAYYVYFIRTVCGGDPYQAQDEGPQYALFCVLLVTYSLELLMWPAYLANVIIKLLRMNKLLDRKRVSGRYGKAKRFEYYLGVLLKCLQCISRGKAGGQDLKNSGELEEFASHIMCLLNNSTKMDLTLSDIYIGFKSLARVQAEKKIQALKKTASAEMDGKVLPRHAALTGRRGSIRVLRMSAAMSDFEVDERKILEELNETDVRTLSDAAHYARYASYVYVKLPTFVATCFGDEFERVFTRSRDTLLNTISNDLHRLSEIGCPQTILMHSNFENSVVATPYSVLIDEEKEKVVICIRGTRSLEDLVVDLQFIPQPLGKVGERCGFDGRGHHAHKGFLARSKWIINDLKKRMVLDKLYEVGSPYENFGVVVCGHSLGGGVAAILSLMLRPSFPGLHCFAYEPPGCIFSTELTRISRDFITSFVRQDDVIPRLSYHNFERVRDSFFDVFCRIKVPKIHLFFDLRRPCADRFLEVRNAMVLRPHDAIPKDTSFYATLEEFRAERAAKNSKGVNVVQLHVPGRIIHLIDSNNSGLYHAYWAKQDDFNTVEISSRMLSDHDIHCLPDVLSNIKFGDVNRVSLGFANAPLIYTDDEDEADTDARLFVCCLNPYGRLPVLLLLACLVASFLHAYAIGGCDFVDTSFSYSHPVPDGERGEIVSIRMLFGLHSYRVIDCTTAAGEQCPNVDDIANDECQPFPVYWDLPSMEKVSRVFGILTSVTGLVGLCVVVVSICFFIRKRTWLVASAFFLLASFCQGMMLTFTRSGDFHGDDPAMADVVFTLGPGGICAAVAAGVWFALAVGSAHLGRQRAAGADGDDPGSGEKRGTADDSNA
mmetsp:Transcript_34896/g.78621  ORF Transcript_34896/g.78621 Transcript_34896/m.78621 type:complete len:993 (-) Transcript_34896:106-3084(-)